MTSQNLYHKSLELKEQAHMWLQCMKELHKMSLLLKIQRKN